MRIAFVGKGGSGKTTMAAFFSQFLKEKQMENILSIDADINIHLPELLLEGKFPKDKFISLPEPTKKIKKYLIGNNSKLKPEEFRKTIPPSKSSNLINLAENQNPLLKEFSVSEGKTKTMVVGTYEPEGIGTSCYHTSLAILENMLTHMVDKEGVVVVDMVAGTDAFASSLHIQFDIIVLVVEPTRRGLEVFNNYIELAKSAGIEDSVFVVGNKINSEIDREFLEQNIPKDNLLGLISDSKYIRNHDKTGGVIDFNLLEEENRKLFSKILDILRNNIKDPNERLKKMHELHKKYISRPFITERFGDLTWQIDEDFRF